MSAWNDFLAEVRNAESELGNPTEVWFRGHSNLAWNLSPSLFRIPDWEKKEKLIFTEFTKTASRLFDKRTNDWETLFDMQHYWIPTRLLDWTTVMGVAIAFILHGEASEADSALFVLNPVALNRLSKIDDVLNIPEDKTFEYKKMYWENKPIQIERPIAIRPTLQSDRLIAQKGTFTVGGTVDFSFEDGAQNCMRKIILPNAAKDEAREFLKWANLDEYTIYPDIVGMAYHIKRKFT